jgi:hypothetical protein
MSNAEPELKVPASTTQEVKDIESERSSLDSYHDNTSSRNHPIINKLYNNKTSYTVEDKFIEYIEKQTIPDEYYVNRIERIERRLRGFFTTRMECLVNKTPLHFKDNSDTSLTFVYDQGPHPINYFKNAVNGIFISDAVDTAPKLTKQSQRPVLFTTPQNIITVPGSYIGFNENIVRSVVFSDFKGVKDQVQCKVIIQASLDGENFRWFDLSQKFDATSKKLIGYTILNDAMVNAKYKESNSRNTGFFIGNANAEKLLGNKDLKPILALCLVAAKILGDFSSALASSPTITSQYTGAKELYGAKNQISNPEMIIHASGDRLCSLEASRQGGNSIKTSPRNSDGIIPIQYTPGVDANEPINYKQRFDTIKAEIILRFEDLLLDVEYFTIEKYKVDGQVVSEKNTQKLERFVKGDQESSLIKRIRNAKKTVELYILALEDKYKLEEEDKTKYEILYRRKIALMPQSPLISTQTKERHRKNLNTKFHIYKLSDTSKDSINLRDEVFSIMSLKGGRRLRRTPRSFRGGMDALFTPKKLGQKIKDEESPKSDQESQESVKTKSINGNSSDSQADLSQSDPSSTSESELDKGKLKLIVKSTPSNKRGPDVPAEQLQCNTKEQIQSLQDFETLMYTIQESMINFALKDDEPKSGNDPIKQFILEKGDSIDQFIKDVKCNTHTDEKETIANYDEEFMEEFEQVLEQIKEEKYQSIVDDTFIKVFEQIEVEDYKPSKGGRKRKTYRRIRLF